MWKLAGWTDRAAAGCEPTQVSILIVGHPRCGTAYSADFCGGLGLGIGHEEIGIDGISSWMFAVDDRRTPYGRGQFGRRRRAVRWRHMVHAVRDLRSAAESVVIENRHAKASLRFRSKHIQRLFGVDLNGAGTDLERAIWSIVYWSRIIRAQDPSHVFRIEDGACGFVEFLTKSGLAKTVDTIPEVPPSNVQKKYSNGFWGRAPSRPIYGNADWEGLESGTRELVEEYCSIYGYPSPLGVQSRHLVDRVDD